MKIQLVVFLSFLILIPLVSANPALSITVTSKKVYAPGVEAKINGTVTMNGSPVPDAAVAIEVDNKTSGKPYLIRSKPTSTNPATTWPIEVTQVYLSDEYGTPKSSVKQGDVAYFRILGRSAMETDQTVSLIQSFQSGSVPFSITIPPPFQEVVAAGRAYNETFGKLSIGSLLGQMDGNKKFASSFQLGIPQTYHANVTSVNWYGYSNLTVHAKAVIYSSNKVTGKPNTLVGTSQEVLLSAMTPGWWDFPFNPAVTLAGNFSYYWLGIICEPATLYFRYDPGYIGEYNVSAFAYNNDLYSDGPSNPFGTPTYQNRSMNIRANYTLIQDVGIDTIINWPVPTSAPTGTATIYVTALKGYYPSCLPKNGGTAYSPSKAANFTITSLANLAASYTPTNSGTFQTTSLNGYYELRFTPVVGNYTAYVSCYYQGETATGNVTFRVGYNADVNGDGKVDGKDVALVSRAYNTKPGDPKWDPRADINGDLKVDGKDVALVAKYYGT